jgi:site-specific DNA-methyltransferase (adenine-specific)
MNCTLYKGDCLVEMNNIQDHSADLILCDLPYGSTHCTWDIVIPFDQLWEQYNRIAKKNAAIVLFGNEPFSSYLRLSNIKNYRYDLVWEKESITNFMQVKRRFGKSTEMISVFYKAQPTYNPQMVVYTGKPANNKPAVKSNQSLTTVDSKGFHIKPYVDNGLRYPRDVLRFNRVPKTQTLHPTQKPVELLEYLIKSFTNEDMTVLDNCMGSGSTGVACINTNRNFIGIELDDNYFKIADNRLKEAMELNNESNSTVI